MSGVIPTIVTQAGSRRCRCGSRQQCSGAVVRQAQWCRQVQQAKAGVVQQAACAQRKKAVRAERHAAVMQVPAVAAQWQAC